MNSGKGTTRFRANTLLDANSANKIQSRGGIKVILVEEDHTPKCSFR